MLLRNYDNINLSRKFFEKSSNVAVGDNLNQFEDGIVTIKSIDGTIGRPSNSIDYTPFNYFYEKTYPGYNTYGYGYSYLWCGSGTSAPHYDDYCLERAFSSDEIASLSNTTTVKREYDKDTDSWIFTHTKTFSAKTNIIINEIGVYYDMYLYLYNSTSTTSKSVLLYRQILDTPFEVEADGLFKLVFSMTVYANPNRPADYTAKIEPIE